MTEVTYFRTPCSERAKLASEHQREADSTAPNDAAIDAMVSESTCGDCLEFDECPCMECGNGICNAVTGGHEYLDREFHTVLIQKKPRKWVRADDCAASCMYFEPLREYREKWGL